MWGQPLSGQTGRYASSENFGGFFGKSKQMCWLSHLCKDPSRAFTSSNEPHLLQVDFMRTVLLSSRSHFSVKPSLATMRSTVLCGVTLGNPPFGGDYESNSRELPTWSVKLASIAGVTRRDLGRFRIRFLLAGAAPLLADAWEGRLAGRIWKPPIFHIRGFRVSVRKLLSVGLVISLSPCTSAQSGPTFRARLDGGSKGVPLHLEGKLYISPHRIEFEAFPQIENIVWSCEKIKHLGRRRETVTIDSASGTYRLNVNSPEEAERFADTATFACKGSPES